ncbi:C-4 sterol methyl oxidase [Novymonas esmeraldas]|uniref:C-4 sterol methyl oxidase n=1 Tax=Novymonas esmeraldas TaxID=1808958 RepID=A0AAW0F058_9TRYP
MAPVKKSVVIPPVQTLRPSWGATVLHAFIYLSRHAIMSSLVAVFIVQPLFQRFIVRNSYLQHLSNAALFTLVGAVLCHCVPWLFFNSIFLFFDSIHPQYGLPSLRNVAFLAPLGRKMATYKLPRQPHQIPSAKLMLNTVGHAAFGQYVLIPTALYAALAYSDSCTRCASPPETPIVGFAPDDVAAYLRGQNLLQMLTSLFVVAQHFLLANAINEVGFYSAHALLHSNPTLYRMFHKKHHMYTGTIGIAAEYATPLEEVLANAIPTVGYFVFMLFNFTREEASHSAFVTSARAWPLFMTWMWARLWETYEVHSGYCFENTWLGKLGLMHGHRARFHDFHHTHNVGNYGGATFMDALFNTMDPYLVYRYPQKHPAPATPVEAEEVDEDVKAHHKLAEVTDAIHTVRAHVQ